MTEPLVTAHEVAERFDVKPGTVYDWWQQGKIPAEAVTRIGGTARGRLRFRLSVIEAAWSSSTTSSTRCVRPELVR